MASKHDNCWEHAEPVGGSRRTTKCKYCGKVIHGADSGPYYQSMIDTIAEVGPGIKGSRDTKLEIHNWKRMFKSLRTRKPIINFMIYCDRSMIYHSSVDTTNIPKTADYIFSLMDKVVEEVGKENVVQVVTDNEASFKTTEEVQTIMEHLVKVLKLVDQDKKPILSIIYEAIDKVKLAIKASIKQWEKYREVIDKRWEGQLHKRLHAAAYFLNPMFQYSKHFSNHPEIKVGLKEVIKILEPDLDRQAKSINEVKLFVDGQGEFGSALIKKSINQSFSAEWWNNYGDEGPHLQKIAVKILSQTCSSSDEWIRKREEPILSSDNLDWLDKGLPTNEEGRERDVDSRRKSKASKTISSSSSSDDGDNRGNRRGGGTSGGNKGVGGTSEGTGGDGSTRGGYVSQVDPGMSWAQGEGYSNTKTRASDSYGYDQSSSSSSIAYRGFGYYQYGVDPEQPSKPYFPYYGSSSQSSHLTYSSYEQLFQPYPHYGNCHPNLYTRRRTDDDDFEPPRHSKWN
ncbi:hypothetical protein CK203_039301 [Vitis vinifera]|uniref:DUF659 domain-containing protein n=1 Tax=Vitis vinifera TaxID=29760 RepID=A0A438HGN3_VITVI|nr:hypothetical protein CK203_039301 [Vitis vinifera]